VDIDLIMGAEINIASEINANEISHYALNGTEKYILLELPFISYPTNCDKRIFHFKSLGLSPIIAHPERTFAIMKDPGKLREWKKRGILFQINTKSILGRYGRMVRSVALKMLKDGLADFVASDTHNQKWGFDFDDVRCVLDKIVGKQKTNELLGQNAQRLLLSKGSTVC
jgi:protein-tyrosine phosphatase